MQKGWVRVGLASTLAGLAVAVAVLPKPSQPEASRCFNDVPAPADASTQSSIHDLEQAAGYAVKRKSFSSLSGHEKERFMQALYLLMSRDRIIDSSRPASERLSWRVPVSLDGFMALTAVHGSNSDFDPWLPGSKDLRSLACNCNHSPGYSVDDVDDMDGGLSNAGSFMNAPLFLLWHRAYIHALELSLQSIMREHWRDDEWKTFRLPYWDWTADSHVPEEFLDRDPDLPPKKPWGQEFSEPVVRCPPESDRPILSRNPFYDCMRADQLLSPPLAGTNRAPIIDLGELSDPFDSAQRAFFPAFSYEFFGTWHSAIHRGVGAGGGADMGMQTTAARDPLFWVHHANVDRLWMIWVRKRLAELKSSPVRNYSVEWKSESYQFPIYLVKKDGQKGVAAFYRPTYEDLASNSGSAAMGYSYESFNVPSHGSPKDVSLANAATLSFDSCDDRAVNGSIPFPHEKDRRNTVVLAQASRVEIPAGGLTLKFKPSDIALKDIRDVISRRLEARPCLEDGSSLCAYDSLFVRFSDMDETALARLAIAYQVFVSAGPPKDPLPFNGSYVGSIDLFGQRQGQLKSDTIGLLNKKEVLMLLSESFSPTGGGISPAREIYVIIRPVSRAPVAPLGVTSPDAVLTVESLTLEGRGSHLKEDQRVCKL